MRTRLNTDNFLPVNRGSSYYKSRSVKYAPRLAQTPSPNNSLPLSANLLLPKPEPVQKKPLRKRPMYVLPIIVLVLVSCLVSFDLGNPPVEGSKPLQSAIPVKSSEASPKPDPNNAGLPARLMIPKLNLNAAVDNVGLTSSGDLDVPKNPANAGWYAQGPRPGENGSAVIDGHFGWEDGKPAAFDSLHKLQKGDQLQVEDKNGSVTYFVVRELRKFGPNELALEIFKSSDDRAHLNLITCSGTWNKAQKSYSERLVVFADKTVL